MKNIVGLEVEIYADSLAVTDVMVCVDQTWVPDRNEVIAVYWWFDEQWQVEQAEMIMQRSWLRGYLQWKKQKP